MDRLQAMRAFCAVVESDSFTGAADKMGPVLREFAEYQPFTPIIETLRGFLSGSPDTGAGIAAVAWCVGIAVVGYLWASATFTKRA